MNKTLKGTAAPSVLRAADIGAHTIKAIHHPESLPLAREHYTHMVEALGPSDFYIQSGPLKIGRAEVARPDPYLEGSATDLLYRPNQHAPIGSWAIDPSKIKAGTLAMGNSAASTQVGGTHYGNPATDVYAFSMANGLDPLQFNVVKYVTRFRKKGGLEDLKKAMQTLERLIAHEEGRK